MFGQAPEKMAFHPTREGQFLVSVWP